MLHPGAFQSLTRDSNHSNPPNVTPRGIVGDDGFNPSRGIAIIQTIVAAECAPVSARFNPSRGIAIIQTPAAERFYRFRVKGFNPSRGIAIIQTPLASMLMKEMKMVSIPHAG